MLRLRGACAVATSVASAALPRVTHPSGASSLPCIRVAMKTTAVLLPVAPSMALAATWNPQRQFRFPSVNLRTSPVSCGATPTPTFLRRARLSTPSLLSQNVIQYRWMRAKNQQQQDRNAEETGKEGEESNSKTEGGDQGSDQQSGSSAKGSKNKKGGKGQAKKKSLMDHVRGLRDDYANFPHIYNSVNAINFVVFTVFCLCSTGSNTEERWWLEKWGVDNSVRPWTWLLHSFLTNNFLAMTYAMMLLHTMCHHVLPTLGSRGLMMYCGGTAVFSGAIMWLSNYLYYGSTAAPEKQFGPWDVIAALFVMEYLYYGVTPMSILSSFSGWIKYACWVGGVCILYFDWQPTLIGTLVGLAFCKGVPRWQAVRPTTTAA
ncbi:hypothetical protein conserved [Leishmania donovani]|nr:hypothetical protein CGC20_35765 [Leishmania donovani]CAJ1986752.1 hypothetical protein conserved [Leishmania donovani]